MSLDRANLKGGPAKVTWNGVDFYTDTDILASFDPSWADVNSSMYGVVDKVAIDNVFQIPLRLWGAWENISTLFPSSVLTPTIGQRIFGTTDLPLVIHAKNQDRITFHNAQITGLPDLYLGVDKTIFAADVQFTALIRNTYDPDTAAAYFTIDTAAFTETFSKTNFKQQRYSAAWGAVAGFTSFQAKEGWNVSWGMKLEPEKSANLGTVDMVLTDFMGTARCIPVESTMAQISAAAKMQGTGNALGRLLSATAADLTITGSGVSVALKNAGLAKHAFAFGSKPLRNGEITWETTVGFSAGSPGARAALS